MRVGDRVAVGQHKGTLVEPDEEFFAGAEDIRRSKSNYLFVRFDEKGPYGTGRGIYFYTTWMLRRLNEPRREIVNDGNAGETTGTTKITDSTIKD